MGEGASVMDLPTETRGHIEQRLSKLEGRVIEMEIALRAVVNAPPVLPAPPPPPDEPEFDLPEKSA